MSDTLVSRSTDVRGALAWARRNGLDTVDARVLLGYVLGCDHAQLLAPPERPLPDAEIARFREFAGRRIAGEPVAYLTGAREFYGREFAVSPDVPIPRPETELLVDLALRFLTGRNVARVLDLGTGCGCIAISIACERPALSLCGIDVSAAALQIARANAARLLRGENSSPTWRPGDWYQAIAGQRFDLIVSNPPYVSASDPHLARGDLRFEPHRALVGGTDGLDALRTIVGGAARHLAPGGGLIVEHGFDQAPGVLRLFAAAGFTQVESHRDLAGHPRVVSGAVPT